MRFSMLTTEALKSKLPPISLASVCLLILAALSAVGIPSRSPPAGPNDNHLI
jgi:hypothetical protein